MSPITWVQEGRPLSEWRESERLDSEPDYEHLARAAARPQTYPAGARPQRSKPNVQVIPVKELVGKFIV